MPLFSGECYTGPTSPLKSSPRGKFMLQVRAGYHREYWAIFAVVLEGRSRYFRMKILSF